MLISTHYTITLIESDDRKLTAYFLHPIAMKHRLQGIPLGDMDGAWYTSELPDDDRPASILLTRTLQSEHWPERIGIKRITDTKQVERLDGMIHLCAIIDHFDHCAYSFYPGVYAITHDAVYVADELEECFYKLPCNTEHMFEKITLNDNVGILTMDGHRYIALDERMLYIPIAPKQLHKYGIEKVDCIELHP